MPIDHTVRSSASPFVRSITRSVASSDGQDTIVPDGLWDIIVARDNGQVRVFLVSTPLLRAVRLPHTKGQETLIISFEVGVFISLGPLFEKKGFYALPLSGEDSFKLGTVILKIPTLETADAFIEELTERGLLVQDDVVESVATGGSRGQSNRTAQRHFKQVTGMTPNYYQQVQRATHAADLLRQGKPALTVAHDLGYYDQFHLSKSLKAIFGRSPSDIE